jgi:hypothetical protein
MVRPSLKVSTVMQHYIEILELFNVAIIMKPEKNFLRQ